MQQSRTTISSLGVGYAVLRYSSEQNRKLSGGRGSPAEWIKYGKRELRFTMQWAGFVNILKFCHQAMTVLVWWWVTRLALLHRRYYEA